MTTKREYRCNLCNSRVVDTADGRGDIEGVGVMFMSYDGPFRFTLCYEAENHICGPCVSQIRKRPETELPKVAASA